MIAKKKVKDPPADLVKPSLEKPEPPATWDTPLLIRYVNHIDMEALCFNLVSVLACFAVFILAVGQLTANRAAVFAIPASLCWILIVILRIHLWTSVDARKAGVWLDYLNSKRLVIYTQGFHFTPWTSREQVDEIDFQKHEAISMKKTEKTEIRFETNDGYEMAAEVVIFYNLRDGADAMSRALKYEDDEIKAFIKAVVIERLTDLGGCNSYESLLYYKAEAARWLAMTFEGESKLSQFEIGLGIALRNPILESLDLTDESKKTFGVRAKIEVITDGIKSLKREAGLSADEANLAAQAAEGILTRNVQTYQGIPQGAKVVALGDHGIAIAAKGR